MSVHRMDFLVQQHQAELLREARDRRLSEELRQDRSGSDGEQAGGFTLAPMRYAVHLAMHDLRSHRLHRHHVGHHIHRHHVGHHA